MPTPESHTALPPSKLDDARRWLRSFVQRMAEETQTTGREMAIEAICSGLQSLPVPVLNTALAKTVRRALTGGPGSPPADPREVLDLLGTMQESNEEFERGLRELGSDLDEIREDIAAVRATLTEPDLQLTNVKTELNWPVSDNRVSALLTNNGGGSVQVNEIFIDVEAWEPELTIDYSVPLAPLIILELRADLSTAQQQYPLFELNDVPPRTFEERGTGAERISIDLSSAENVRYSLRVRVPYTDNSGRSGTLLFPPGEEDPLVFPFICAPGWQSVDAGKLHGADALYLDMRDKLSQLVAVLHRVEDPSELAKKGEELERIGMPPFPAGFSSFVRNFVPLFAELGASRDITTTLAVTAELLCYGPPDQLGDVSEGHPAYDALLGLAGGTSFEPSAIEFASRLGDPHARVELGRRLLESIRS